MVAVLPLRLQAESKLFRPLILDSRVKMTILRSLTGTNCRKNVRQTFGTAESCCVNGGESQHLCPDVQNLAVWHRHCYTNSVSLALAIDNFDRMDVVRSKGDSLERIP